MKCYLALNYDIRKTLFTEYWALGTHDKRVAFIARLITRKEKQVIRHRKPKSAKTREVTYQYSFEINGRRVEVCKDCFCRTTQEDKRGKQSTANKRTELEMNDVRAHNNSFQAHERHYTRKTNDKKYLQSHLNLRIMYNLYKEGRENFISRTIYEREFHKMKLSFKKPYVDTCVKCDTLNMHLKVTTDLNNIKEKTDLMLPKEWISLRLRMTLRRNVFLSIFSSSLVFYKRQLWTYNLTIHDNATGESTNYMWHEVTAGRGANEIASCLYYHYLGKLSDEIKDVTFYTDTCGGQNQNSHVAAMFLKAICDFPHLNCINLKFLIPGHTHKGCDVDHSMIEKRKKKIYFQIFHPHDRYQLVREKTFLVHE
ncbi:uncharacterized protein [Leptinotarsa decemlineata]|uniref:uncharacterized protein n=1 Tax=Leptinotarsa decemlineata TaxID=7539 RepID=UPI003D3074FE